MAETLLQTCFDTVCANCVNTTNLTVKNAYSVWQNTDYDGVKCTSFCGYNYFCACTTCPMGHLFSALYYCLNFANYNNFCFPVRITGQRTDGWTAATVMKIVPSSGFLPNICFYDRNRSLVFSIGQDPDPISSVSDSIIFSFVSMEL